MRSTDHEAPHYVVFSTTLLPRSYAKISLYSAPYALHAPPISFFSILLPK